MKRVKRYGLAVCIAALCAQGLMPASAQAQGYDSTLTGDWGGERAKLAADGYNFVLTYQSQTTTNRGGGDRNTTAYTDQLIFIGIFDLKKIWNWDGATFHVMYTERTGRNIDNVANIPAFEQQQLIWGRGQTWWLTEFALIQKLYDDKLELHIGRITPDSDFDMVPCDTQYITFCGGPPPNLVGGQYWYNWPASQWGAVVTYNYLPNAWIKLGAYQNNPDYSNNNWVKENAWKPWKLGRSDGALMPLEFGYAPSIGGLPGKYMIGAWTVTTKTSDIYLNANHEPLAEFGGSALQGKSRYGGYISLLQQVTGDADHGLTLNLNSTAADKMTTYLDRESTFNMEYHGPFGRSKDIVGLSIGATQANPRFAHYLQEIAQETGTRSTVGYTYEYESELFYSWVPNAVPWLNLRPNLQYIVHPGGSTLNKNSLGIGLNMFVSF